MIWQALAPYTVGIAISVGALVVGALAYAAIVIARGR